MDMSYDTFRDLESAFKHFHQCPGDWDALTKLNQALKDSGLQNDAVRAASKNIDRIVAQSIIEEEEWKELEASGLTLSLFVELNLAEMRHYQDKKAPFLDLYEQVLWLKDDLNTIKTYSTSDHLSIWKQVLYLVRKLERDQRVDNEQLKIVFQNIHFIEDERKETGSTRKNFAPYILLLSQTHEVLTNYLVYLQTQGYKKPEKNKKAA